MVFFCLLVVARVIGCFLEGGVPSQVLSMELLWAGVVLMFMLVGTGVDFSGLVSCGTTGRSTLGKRV